MLRTFVVLLVSSMITFGLARFVPSDLPNLHALAVLFAWLLLFIDIYLFAFVLKYVIIGRALGIGYRGSRRGRK